MAGTFDFGGLIGIRDADETEDGAEEEREDDEEDEGEEDSFSSSSSSESEQELEDEDSDEEDNDDDTDADAEEEEADDDGGDDAATVSAAGCSFFSLSPDLDSWSVLALAVNSRHFDATVVNKLLWLDTASLMGRL